MPDINTYKGYKIEQSEDGFYWHHGGYCETLDETKEEIDDWLAAEEAHYAALVPSDTPCLPEPWWAQK